MTCKDCVYYPACTYHMWCDLFKNKADVVEVVRCCDCEYKQENPDINNTCYLTCNLKYGIRGTIDPTDFCSYGKRKGD